MNSIVPNQLMEFWSLVFFVLLFVCSVGSFGLVDEADTCVLKPAKGAILPDYFQLFSTISTNFWISI